MRNALPDPPPTTPSEASGADLTRRFFLQSAGSLAVASVPVAAQTPSPSHMQGPAPTAPLLRAVQLDINGQTHDLMLESRVTLLDALRESLGMMGTKKGCDRGQCGACTVLIEGRRINSCLTLAAMHTGERITTIEGLGTPDQLHPMQAAFIEKDAFQCGYCTPGQVCSAVALLSEFRSGAASAVTSDVRARPTDLTDDEIRERMSGNLCRCGAYANIVAAVKQAALAPDGRAAA